MINDRDYLNGSPLWDSIFQFGNPELAEIYATPVEYIRNKPEGGLGDIVNYALKGLLDIQNQAEQRQKILSMLKKDILAQIEKGDLIPYGFKDPRNIEDI